MTGMRWLSGLACAALLVAGCSNNSTTSDDLSVPLDGPMNDLRAGSQDGQGAADLLAPADLRSGDLAMAPCANTTASCGMPGACVNCTTSTTGNACVAMHCGCNVAADCPMGTACNTTTHLCGGVCGGGSDGGVTFTNCNGGCCDGTNCRPGNATTVCGSTGGACVACGGGTPTCSAGSCTAACVVGAGGANCGTGFCCGTGNQCQAIGNTSCGVAGGACTNCTTGMAGLVCRANGMCGCATAADCPPGNSCNPTTNTCTTNCSSTQPCSTGCCSAATGGTCVAGNTAAHCAVTGGAVCATCATNNTACVTSMGTTFCGCNTAADCQADQACDTGTHQCTTACSSTQPCNGGCCSAATGGTCVAGTAPGACGNSGGVCQNCGTNFNNGTSGNQCITTTGGGFCGCNMATQCPLNASGCGVTGNANLCNFACSATVACGAGFCCNGGTCALGTANTACGASGMCTDCTALSTNHICLPGKTCGCNSQTDCTAGQACNTTTNACGTACGGPNQSPCNGGCCSTGGMCIGGTMPVACGSNGNACMPCTGAVGSGSLCLGGNRCGCNAASDCNPGVACDTTTHTCVAACTANSVCNGCCQAGQCLDGRANNSTCGATGGACVACANGTPTCRAGACTANCGGANDGTCSNGFCCGGGMCVAGNMNTACGDSGACVDCTTFGSNGQVCVPKAGFVASHCGCNMQTDCPYAHSCDTNAKICGLVCGMTGLTACNGGCCDGAGTGGTFQCLAQPQVPNSDMRCGNAGQFCQDCTANVLQMCTMGGPPQAGNRCVSNNNFCGCRAGMAGGDCGAGCLMCNANSQCTF